MPWFHKLFCRSSLHPINLHAIMTLTLNKKKKKEEKERISLIDPTHSILLTLKVMIVFILTICVSLFSFFDHLYLILLSYCHIEIAIYFRN